MRISLLWPSFHVYPIYLHLYNTVFFLLNSLFPSPSSKYNFKNKAMDASCFLTSKIFNKSVDFPHFNSRKRSAKRLHSFPAAPSNSSITTCNLQSWLPEDDREQTIKSDWRSFRARLVAGEQASCNFIDSATSQSPVLGDRWVHGLHEPERGCLLIATEKLDGVHIFEHTIILLISTAPLCPTGVILNRPSLMSIKEMKSTAFDINGTFSDRPLFFGGPLDEGLFLVSSRKGGGEEEEDGVAKSGVFEEVMKGLYYGTKESLGCAAEMVKRNMVGVGDFRFFDGYCGWEKDQLKEEIRAGYWNVVACSLSVVEMTSAGLWEEVMGLVGERKVWNMNPVEANATAIPKDKKRKNFMWSLRPECITGLLEIMGEYVDGNMRSAQGFKEVVYKGAAQKLKERFGIDVTIEQCKNQIRHQRTVWAHIQSLKKKSGVSWDENKKIILMGHEEYTSHIQAFPKDAIFLNVPITNYAELEKVCSEGHATGEWAKSASCQTPFGSQPINLEEDDTYGFRETGADASPPMNWADVEIKEEEISTTKRAMSSSSKGSAARKRGKRASTSEGLGEYINMVVDSIAQVANAIQGTTKAIERTTKAVEEKKIFTELTTELKEIPGFTDEELDTIYDNLSNNTTTIQSFLSKSAESKARWMRKELDKSF